MGHCIGDSMNADTLRVEKVYEDVGTEPEFYRKH